MGRTSYLGTVRELRDHIRGWHADKPIAYQVWEENDINDVVASLVEDEECPEGIRFTPEEVVYILDGISFSTEEEWDQIRSLIFDVIEKRKKGKKRANREVHGKDK